MNWYPHYPGDYARDTGKLTMMEHGAYRILLDHYYSLKGDVDANTRRLNRMVGAIEDDEKNALQFVVDQFFTVEDGKLRHKRADDELAKALKKSEKAAESARRRWGAQGCERNANAYANADANALQTHMPSQCSPHPHPHPHPEPTPPPVKDSASRRFVRPSVDQVKAYCDESGRRVDAEQFCDFYASKGWKVGSAPMKDWKAAVRNWARDDRGRGKHDKPKFVSSIPERR